MSLCTASYDPESWYYHYEPGTPLQTVIDRWKDRPGTDRRGQPLPRQKVYDDSMPAMLSVRELWPLREYTWTRENSRGGFAKVNGKKVELPGPLKWDALKEDLLAHGWDLNDPLRLEIGVDGGVKVGEGNHRLALARELGIDRVPVWFDFKTYKVRKQTPTRTPVPEISPKSVERVVERAVERVEKQKPRTPEEQAEMDRQVEELMRHLKFGARTASFAEERQRILEWVDSHTSNGKVRLYREVIIPPGGLRTDSLGVYWTPEKNKAHSPFGRLDRAKGEPVIIEVIAPREGVDDVGTVAAMRRHPGEREIRLLPGTQVQIVSPSRRRGKTATPSLSRLIGRMVYGTPTEEQQEALDTPTVPRFRRLLPFIPAPSGAYTIDELGVLSALAERDRDKHLKLIEQADKDFVPMFHELAGRLGVAFDQSEIQLLMDSAAVVITKLKFHFNRARPFQVASLLGHPFRPLGTLSGHSPAYPSGHTVQSYLLAHHFAALAPEHRDEFFDLASTISWSRALGGYHWPSDLTYGMAIADALAGPLKPSSILVASKYKQGSRTLYHGATQEFHRFDPSMMGRRDTGNLGRGIYLTSDEEMARRYAEDNAQRFGGEPVVLKVRASLRNTAPFSDLVPTLKAELGISFPPSGKDSRRAQLLRDWFLEHGFDSARSGHEYVVFDRRALKVVGRVESPSIDERHQMILKHLQEKGTPPPWMGGRATPPWLGGR